MRTLGRTSSMLSALAIALLVSAPAPSGAAKFQAKAPMWTTGACRADSAPVPARQEAGEPDVLLSFVALPGGWRQMSARSSDLRIEKRVAANGEATILLQAASDTVSVTVTGAAITVRRGTGEVMLSVNSPDEEQMLAVQQVLAGSRAVRRLRTLAGRLENGKDKDAGRMGIAVTDALLGFLTGDTGAPARFASRMRAEREGRLRPAGFAGEDFGCYRKWESEVMTAWIEYEGCLDDFAWWNPLKEACTIRYLVWVESAWFEFLGCSALPLNQ